MVWHTTSTCQWVKHHFHREIPHRFRRKINHLYRCTEKKKIEKEAKTNQNSEQKYARHNGNNTNKNRKSFEFAPHFIQPFRLCVLSPSNILYTLSFVLSHFNVKHINRKYTDTNILRPNFFTQTHRYDFELVFHLTWRLCVYIGTISFPRFCLAFEIFEHEFISIFIGSDKNATFIHPKIQYHTMVSITQSDD